MRPLITLMIVSLFIISQTVSAHGNHRHINSKEAQLIASDVAAQFVDYDPGLGFGKLPKSWQSIAFENIKLHQRGEGYYIVSIANIAEDKVLYILISNTGEAYDANFSGLFENLEQ